MEISDKLANGSRYRRWAGLDTVAKRIKPKARINSFWRCDSHRPRARIVRRWDWEEALQQGVAPLAENP